MKSLLKVFLVLAVFAFAGESNAQNTKLGHINYESFVSTKMPEMMKSQTELLKKRAEHIAVLEEMQVEINIQRNTIEENQKLPKTDTKRWSQSMLESKIMAYQDAEKRLQQKNAKAEQDIKAEQGKLMNPIMEKFQTAIKAVGKELKLTYILNEGTTLFQGEGSLDLSENVLLKLYPAQGSETKEQVKTRISKEYAKAKTEYDALMKKLGAGQRGMR